MHNTILEQGLVKLALHWGGSIHPLIIPAEQTNGTGLMNPSIYNHNGELWVNVRHVNYTLYHSENKRFQHRYGPLQYLHPENDRRLRTWNYLCRLDADLNITSINKVDTSKLDVEPIWEFVGLEDGRLIVWDDEFFLCGVRRDTTTNGVGRMELSRLEITEDTVREVERTRMPAPLPDSTYCEKNWMPVVDKPYYWVKWSNPTELVEYDRHSGVTHTRKLDKSKVVPNLPDFRGSSHVLAYRNSYIAVSHEVNLFKPRVGQKDAAYYHRILVWDRDWNLVDYTDAFSFMGADIEFCCGAAIVGDDLLVSFGYQDNAAFILRFPLSLLDELLEIL